VLRSFESTTLRDAECRSLTRAVANLDAGDVPEAAGVRQIESPAIALVDATGLSRKEEPVLTRSEVMPAAPADEKHKPRHIAD
jgi:hypothetical protein